jgi:hypothetical protein
MVSCVRVSHPHGEYGLSTADEGLVLAVAAMYPPPGHEYISNLRQWLADLR